MQTVTVKENIAVFRRWTKLAKYSSTLYNLVRDTKSLNIIHESSWKVDCSELQS